MNLLKICTKCNLELNLEDFSKDNSTKTGYRAHYKKCCKEYREKNKINTYNQKKEWLAKIKADPIKYKEYKLKNKEHKKIGIYVIKNIKLYI